MRAASLNEGINLGSTPSVPGFHTQAALHCLQASAFATAITSADEVDVGSAIV